MPRRRVRRADMTRRRLKTSGAGAPIRSCHPCRWGARLIRSVRRQLPATRLASRRVNMESRLTALLASAFLLLAVSEADSQNLRIGIVDFYGLQRVSEIQARSALTVKEGDTMVMAGDAPAPFVTASERRLATLPGVRRAHLAVVCCDAGRAIVYVGLEETDSSVPHFRDAPRGPVRLAADVVQAGRDFSAARVRGQKSIYYQHGPDIPVWRSSLGGTGCPVRAVWTSAGRSGTVDRTRLRCDACGVRGSPVSRATVRRSSYCETFFAVDGAVQFDRGGHPGYRGRARDCGDDDLWQRRDPCCSCGAECHRVVQTPAHTGRGEPGQVSKRRATSCPNSACKASQSPLMTRLPTSGVFQARRHQ